MFDAVSAAPAAATLPLFLPQAPPDKVSGLIHAATLLAQLLGQGRAIDSRALRSAMETAFCAGDADGAWVWKDAYEALEAAQVMFLHKFGAAMRTRAGSATAMLDMLSRLAARLPTQTRRSEESEHLQQFSTPMTLGYVAAEAAMLTSADFVLEPSAGTGLLAIFAELAKARLGLNEIADTRAGLLARLFRGIEVGGHNAEQIHDRLDPAIRPSVVLMNPPFSASPSIGGRFAEAAIRHLRSAFARLADGGRLVAITGHNLAPDNPTSRDGFIELQQKGRVVFTAAISGQAYVRHGTNFETRLTVIDRVPAEKPRCFPPSPGRAADAAQLLGWVLRLVPNRPPVIDATPLPPPAPGSSPGQAVFLRSAPVRPKAPPPPLPLAKRPAPVPDAAELAYETRDWTPASHFSAGLYEGYALQTVHFAEAQPHPTKLVQSAAMAAVAPPRPSYRPLLPPRLISAGILSDAQLESVVYAGEAHASHLAGFHTVDETYDLVSAAPDDAKDAVRFRRGWFLGDGTGAGKGRQVAAIILDNWFKGRRKAVWTSKSDKLIEDAERDWTAVGGFRSDIVPLSRFRQGAAIALEEGILFTTYATLRTPAKADKISRIQQIIDWLGRSAGSGSGAGFDGVIVFDEAHAMANAAGDKSERGEKKPSQQGQAGLRLQHALPDARILYVSATGATTVQNLAYAARLSLWGAGDFPFATQAEFVAAMEKGGVAAMEVLARDLKALGLYAARSLSFEGIEYEIVEHPLSPEQIRIYDAYADAFQIIHRNLNEALKAANITGSNGDTYNRNAKAAARSAFESNKQRFFNHLLTAMKCPTLIAAIARDLEAGHAIVLQIVSTNEALLDRRLAEIPSSEWSDLSIDITPREYVLDYLQHSFPTQLFELYSDEEGNLHSRPAYDADGNPAISREAVDRRDRMIENLASLPPVQGALDQILHRFGTDLVAEVTGRSRRVVKRGDRLCVENRPASANFAETAAFMDDEKRILVFSDAGGTGRSYHADLGCRNQRRRIHYLLEPGWRADAAIQGLGRSNRTNQKQPPVFRPVATDVKGEKRFLSTIARRLDTLGAITRGQRQTGGQGLFRADDNLESPYAKAALRQFYQLVYAGKIEGCSLSEFQDATGLDLVDQDGSLREELPPITQFLNRILALRINLQNTLFAAFEELLEARIEAAIAAGTYDIGLETLTAESFRIAERRTVYTHAASGAVTCCYRVQRRDRNRPLPLAEALALRATPGRLLINEQSHRAAVQVTAATLMHDDGTVVARTRLVRPIGRETLTVDEFARSHWRPATRDHFAPLWEAECAQVPEFAETEFHIITGLLLPIWDRLPAENMRVYRFETDDRERVIGRLVTPEALSRIYANLGVNGAPPLPADDAWRAVFERGAVLDLAGGLEVRRSAVMSRCRVELTGFTDGMVPQLKALGLVSEIIAWRLRLFVPTAEDRGPALLAALLERHPLLGTHSLAAA